MSLRIVLTLSILSVAGLGLAAESSHKLESAGKLPDGISPKVASILNAEGIRLAGPDGPVLEVWFAKELDFVPGFSPTFTVNYPFKPGQFIGLIKVVTKSDYTDFRGQEMGAGVYTLRYGQQPQDGNHIGTSDTSDFLLALPAKIDKDPTAAFGFDKLSMTSAKSVGSTHPAIFSLLASKKVPAKATVEHNEDSEFWIINAPLDGKVKDKKSKVGLRFVAIGRSEE